MRSLLRTSVAVTALLCSSITAVAGDWAGPYVGVYYGAGVDGLDSDIAGIQGGYNFAASGNLYFGFEADYGWATTGAGEIWSVSGRIATEATTDMLLFASVGYGETKTAKQFTIGAIGMQYALTPSFAVRASVDGYWIGGGASATVVKIGGLYGF